MGTDTIISGILCCIFKTISLTEAAYDFLSVLVGMLDLLTASKTRLI